RSAHHGAARRAPGGDPARRRGSAEESAGGRSLGPPRRSQARHGRSGEEAPGRAPRPGSDREAKPHPVTASRRAALGEPPRLRRSARGGERRGRLTSVAAAFGARPAPAQGPGRARSPARTRRALSGRVPGSRRVLFEAPAGVPLKSVLAAALVLLLAGGGWAVARAQESVHVTADSVVFERFQSMRFQGDTPDDADEDMALPPADEIALARALMLLRAWHVDEALPALHDLWLRYPASPRIASATAAAYLRAGRPFDAMHLLEASDKAAREARAKLGSKAEAPAVDPLAAMKANVLLAMGRRKDAIPWMVEASAAPRGTAFALRGQLLEWADTDDVGPQVVAAAERRADAAPKDVNRALLAAEIECRAGKIQAALARLARAEPAGVPHGQLAHA